jgi:hypothetical protein
MNEPKRRKWSVAIEADDDISADEIRAAIVDSFGIDIVNIEEIEPVAGERDAEPGCASDEHSHCDRCGVCEKNGQCICYAR